MLWGDSQGRWELLRSDAGLFESACLLVCHSFLFFIILCLCSACLSLTASTSPAAPAPLRLSAMRWCGKPALVFRDLASPFPSAGNVTTVPVGLGPANGKPVTLTDWKIVKANLGFTVFLPATLPQGSCLLSASSSLRDPVFGSNFTISYVLPDHDSLVFAQGQLRGQSGPFACTTSQKNPSGPSTTQPTTVAVDPLQICSGVRDKTAIIFSTRGTQRSLQKMFQALQANETWLPA